ncbi:hypothetical protein ZOSMA_70G00800 [Zostera marina]|uniref:RRM domain-containing protein n=1 Tax=Zostera marina TaxID=29655 RepID=A0A0K9NQN1_ZOSMR|nr:hypothetical protein ZOSMA_70G00800 [Zostera marina]
MGTVDCVHELSDLNNLDLEPNIMISIGDKVEFDQVKDGDSLSSDKESNEDEKESNSDKEKTDDSITVLPISRLNPLAEEFVPRMTIIRPNSGNIVISNAASCANVVLGVPKRRNSNSDNRRQTNSRTNLAQREERIKRTIYVCDIDLHISEDYLASLFSRCGSVVDCRICIDPNSIHRVAFIEFTDEVGSAAALDMSGTIVGFFPIKVLPSRTAIAPVNPTYLPRSDSEREICNRTIYCKNIDKNITQPSLKDFFQTVCGQVAQLKLLGDATFPTRIAFIEFVMAESAVAALSCSGIMLGNCSIRISPSKTPIRIPAVGRPNRN